MCLEYLKKMNKNEDRQKIKGLYYQLQIVIQQYQQLKNEVILIKKLINSIKKDFPEDAIYISNLISELKNKVEIVIDAYSFEENKDEFIQELTNITKIIEDIKSDLDINYGQLTMGELRNEKIDAEERLNPNYEQQIGRAHV